jgi:hypothetical protein
MERVGVRWTDFDLEAPDLAAFVRGRIEGHGLAILATIAADGSPRISAIEPMFAEGDLWLGSMPDSLKGEDLKRDPRFAMHNATTDKDVTEGDVKLNGLAVFTEERPEFLSDMPAEADLFRVELVRVSSLRVAGDHLVIQRWRPGEAVTSVDRY